MAGDPKWSAGDVRTALAPAEVVVPSVAAFSPELRSYDQLLSPESVEEEVVHVS